MKSLWTVICVLALANLIAMAGFVGWLGATDRLGWARLRQVREVLAPTNADLALKAEEEKKQEEKIKVEEAEKKRMAGPPESATERIDRNQSEDDAKAQAKLRMQREQEDLGRTLQLERTTLDAQRADLAAERKKFEDARATFEEQTRSEQFKQALATLESQKPKDAFGVLKSMIDGQKREQALAYLAAMGDRARSKVVAEFIKADEKLAANLLEQLRQRGVTAPRASVEQK